MSAYPNTVHFTHLNRPVTIEWSARSLPVEGRIPAEIDGAFFRAVPDPAQAPLFEDDHALSGDGMISRFRVENGHVDHDIRYVRTRALRGRAQGAQGAVRPIPQPVHRCSRR